MAGGNWNPAVGKVRPGLYINFVAAALARIQSGERGTVTIPLVLPWGQPKTFLKIEEEGDVYARLGYDINDPEVLPVREAKKRARTVLVYRLNTGEKASVTVAPLTVTAKYGGARGNDITVKITTNVLDDTRKDVVTMVNGRVVDEQIAGTVAELVNNNWVDWSGTGNLENTAGATLTGGTNGTVINQDYTDYLGSTETQFFDVIGYPVDEPTLKTSFVTFIKRMRDEEGKKIVGVLPEYAGDYEGIINVDNGVVLNDGTILSAKDAVAWVSGASAGASISESLTYSVYEGAVDANPRLTNSEIIAALKAGKFIFVNDGERVKVEQDINSLVTYSQEKNQRFSKNRVIRVLDAINNDLMRVFNKSYIGKIDNNADGQALLKAAMVEYFNLLQEASALTNFDPENDIFIDPATSVGEEVYADIGVQAVDSMEKFFFRVGVK